MTISSERLARESAKRPWLVVGIWIAATVVSAVLWFNLIESGTTQGQGMFTVEPDAVKAQRLLVESDIRDERFDTEIMVIRHDSLTVDDPQFRERIDKVYTQILALDSDPNSPVLHDPRSLPNLNLLPPGAAEMLIASDRTGTFIPITLAASGHAEGILEIAESNSTDGFDIAVAGEAATGEDFRKVAKRDLIQGESIGVGIAIVILLLVFRAVGSTWIPIILAAMGIAIATGTVALIGQFYNNIPFFVTNFITMIGLAVGIDYALFIVARYKEERSKGLAVEEAIARSGATANRAVFFSGMIVVIALVGMLIVPTTIFFGMALGAILVVLVTVLASLTFLPALLKLLGDKVYAWKIPVLQIKYFNSDISLGGFWNWVTMRVLKRPVIHLVGVAAVLVALAIPYFDINLGFNGVETLPDDFRSKGAFTYLQEEFPEALGTLSSIDIVVDGGASSQQVRDGMEVLAKSIDSIPALGEAQPYVVSEDGEVGLLQIPLAVSGDSSKANDAVKELRERLIPMSGLPEGVLIGGATAINVAFFDLVSMWTPIVIGIVLALSFVLAPLRVQVDSGPSEGDPHEFALRGSCLRPGRDRVSKGVRGGPVRLYAGAVRRSMGAVVFVHHPVRVVHGLRSLLAQQNPGAIRSDRQERRVDRVWVALHVRHHHRRGAHHGRGFHGIRGRRPRHIPAIRLWSGHRDPCGCDDH